MKAILVKLDARMDVIEKEFRRREGSRSPDRGPTAARGGILDNSHFYRLS
jgi:hypothetical protein